MIVYIVWFDNFYGEAEFQGVFSSEESAQAYIDRYSSGDAHSMRIEETVTDSY